MKEENKDFIEQEAVESEPLSSTHEDFERDERFNYYNSGEQQDDFDDSPQSDITEKSKLLKAKAILTKYCGIVLNSLIPYAKKVLAFAKKRKVITVLCVVVLTVVIAITSVINHFLNKINIVSDDETTPVYSEMSENQTTQSPYIRIPSGEIINTENLVKREDGKYQLQDGTVFDENKTVWNIDGSVVFFDGSYVLADTTAVLADGTTFYADGTLVFQSGRYFKNTGVKTDSDGYMTFSNGKKAHITAFVCDQNGVCTSKDSPLADLGWVAGETWKAFEIIETEKETQAPTPTEAISTTKSKEDNIEPQTTKPEKSTTVAALTPSKPQKTEEQQEEEFEKALQEKNKDIDKNKDKIKKNYNDKKIWYNNNIKNILIMGIDEGSKRYPYGRSDSMIVLSVNKKTKEVKMVSFSRAVYVAIEGYENTRLNHAHGYGGASLAIDTIQKNYKIRIDNYVETGFDTFKQIIDVLGGVKIKLTKKEADALKNKLVASGQKYNGEGTYKLNGETALNYVRLRKIDTDRERTARQRKVLMSISKKIKSLNFSELTKLADKILPLITTDMSKTEILGQLSTLSTYMNGDVKQDVVPHKSSALTLKGEYEVLLIDWDDEVKYVHNLFYGDVKPKYYEY